jgi:hypothetical protein
VNATIRRQLAARKRRIARRIENQPGVERHQPMMTASNIHYEISDRTRAIAPGGIGAIQVVRGARRIVYRLLSWNPWQGVFLRLVERLHGRRLC